MRHSNNHYTDLFGEQMDHDLERLEKHIETLAHVFTDAKMPSEYNVAISRALQENISTQRKNNLVILN